MALLGNNTNSSSLMSSLSLGRPSNNASSTPGMTGGFIQTRRPSTQQQQLSPRQIQQLNQAVPNNNPNSSLTSANFQQQMNNINNQFNDSVNRQIASLDSVATRMTQAISQQTTTLVSSLKGIKDEIGLGFRNTLETLNKLFSERVAAYNRNQEIQLQTDEFKEYTTKFFSSFIENKLMDLVRDITTTQLKSLKELKETTLHYFMQNESFAKFIGLNAPYGSQKNEYQSVPFTKDIADSIITSSNTLYQIYEELSVANQYTAHMIDADGPLIEMNKYLFRIVESSEKIESNTYLTTTLLEEIFKQNEKVSSEEDIEKHFKENIKIDIGEVLENPDKFYNMMKKNKPITIDNKTLKATNKDYKIIKTVVDELLHSKDVNTLFKKLEKEAKSSTNKQKANESKNIRLNDTISRWIDSINQHRLSLVKNTEAVEKQITALDVLKTSALAVVNPMNWKRLIWSFGKWFGKFYIPYRMLMWKGGLIKSGANFLGGIGLPEWMQPKDKEGKVAATTVGGAVSNIYSQAKIFIKNLADPLIVGFKNVLHEWLSPEWFNRIEKVWTWTKNYTSDIYTTLFGSDLIEREEARKRLFEPVRHITSWVTKNILLPGLIKGLGIYFIGKNLLHPIQFLKGIDRDLLGGKIAKIGENYRRDVLLYNDQVSAQKLFKDKVRGYDQSIENYYTSNYATKQGYRYKRDGDTVNIMNKRGNVVEHFNIKQDVNAQRALQRMFMAQGVRPDYAAQMAMGEEIKPAKVGAFRSAIHSVGSFAKKVASFGYYFGSLVSMLKVAHTAFKWLTEGVDWATGKKEGLKGMIVSMATRGINLIIDSAKEGLYQLSTFGWEILNGLAEGVGDFVANGLKTAIKWIGDNINVTERSRIRSSIMLENERILNELKSKREQDSFKKISQEEIDNEKDEVKKQALIDRNKEIVALGETINKFHVYDKKLQSEVLKLIFDSTKSNSEIKKDLQSFFKRNWSNAATSDLAFLDPKKFNAIMTTEITEEDIKTIKDNADKFKNVTGENFSSEGLQKVLSQNYGKMESYNNIDEKFKYTNANNNIAWGILSKEQIELLKADQVDKDKLYDIVETLEKKFKLSGDTDNARAMQQWWIDVSKILKDSSINKQDFNKYIDEQLNLKASGKFHMYSLYEIQKAIDTHGYDYLKKLQETNSKEFHELMIAIRNEALSKNIAKPKDENKSENKQDNNPLKQPPPSDGVTASLGTLTQWIQSGSAKKWFGEQFNKLGEHIKGAWMFLKSQDYKKMFGDAMATFGGVTGNIMSALFGEDTATKWLNEAYKYADKKGFATAKRFLAGARSSLISNVKDIKGYLLETNQSLDEIVKILKHDSEVNGETFDFEAWKKKVNYNPTQADISNAKNAMEAASQYVGNVAYGAYRTASGSYERFNRLVKDSNGFWIPGSKNTRGVGTLDCSQFVSMMLTNAGVKSYIDKNGNAAISTNIYRDLLNPSSGATLRKSLDEAQAGDVIFKMNHGRTDWEKSRAMDQPTHIALILKDPKTQKLVIAESSGSMTQRGGGVKLTPIENHGWWSDKKFTRIFAYPKSNAIFGADDAFVSQLKRDVGKDSSYNGLQYSVSDSSFADYVIGKEGSGIGASGASRFGIQAHKLKSYAKNNSYDMSDEFRKKILNTKDEDLVNIIKDTSNNTDIERLARSVLFSDTYSKFGNNSSFAELGHPFDYFLIDHAYNRGLSRALRVMKFAAGDPYLNASEALNILKNKAKSNPEEVGANILSARLKAYQFEVSNDPSKEKFLKGWSNRAIGLGKLYGFIYDGKKFKYVPEISTLDNNFNSNMAWGKAANGDASNMTAEAKQKQLNSLSLYSGLLKGDNNALTHSLGGTDKFEKILKGTTKGTAFSTRWLPVLKDKTAEQIQEALLHPELNGNKDVVDAIHALGDLLKTNTDKLTESGKNFVFNVITDASTKSSSHSTMGIGGNVSDKKSPGKEAKRISTGFSTR